MSLEIQKREVFRVGVVGVPLDQWEDCDQGTVYQIEEAELEFKASMGEDFIQEIKLIGDSLEVHSVLKTHSMDDPSHMHKDHFFEDKFQTLREPKEIDKFFRPGCSVGKKTVFKRKP